MLLASILSTYVVAESNPCVHDSQYCSDESAYLAKLLKSRRFDTEIARQICLKGESYCWLTYSQCVNNVPMIWLVMYQPTLSDGAGFILSHDRLEGHCSQYQIEGQMSFCTELSSQDNYQTRPLILDEVRSMMSNDDPEFRKDVHKAIGMIIYDQLSILYLGIVTQWNMFCLVASFTVAFGMIAIIRPLIVARLPIDIARNPNQLLGYFLVFYTFANISYLIFIYRNAIHTLCNEIWHMVPAMR